MRHLTVSAVTTFCRCPREYELSYTQRWKSRRFSPALETGSAVHAGREALAEGAELDEALGSATTYIAESRQRSAVSEDREDEFAEKTQTATAHARAMLRAYCDVHAPLSFDTVEQVLEGPLLSERGTRSLTFRKAGKCDGSLRLGGARLIYELKTTSELPHDIIEGLKRGYQIPTYEDLYEIETGEECGGALVDVIKKPTVKRYQPNSRRKEVEPLEAYEQRCYEQLIGDEERFFGRELIEYSSESIRQARRLFWSVASAIREADRNGYRAAMGPPPIAPCTYCRSRRLCWNDDMSGYEVGDAHEELGIAA